MEQAQNNLLHSQGLVIKTRLHIKTYLTFVWSCVLLALWCGIYLTQQGYMGLEWFSRSGSVVVVIGILSGFGGIVQERILVSQLAFQHRLLLLKTRKKLRALKVSEDYMSKEIESVNQQFLTLTERHESSLKVKVGMLELSILILGTLVWGFGDILQNWL